MLTDLQLSICELAKLLLQLRDIQSSGDVFSDGNDFSAAFPPWKKIRVVLERPNEDHRPVFIVMAIVMEIGALNWT